MIVSISGNPYQRIKIPPTTKNLVSLTNLYPNFISNSLKITPGFLYLISRMMPKPNRRKLAIKFFGLVEVMFLKHSINGIKWRMKTRSLLKWQEEIFNCMMKSPRLDYWDGLVQDQKQDKHNYLKSSINSRWIP